MPIAAHAQTGAIASAGFLTLGLFWITTTSVGYFSAVKGSIRVHREWMTRSYALTFAAVTLRVYLPLLALGGLRFDVAYQLVAWLCWIPNWLVAEWMLRERLVRASSRVALSAQN